MPALTPAQAIRAFLAAAHVDRISTVLSGEWSAYHLEHGMSIDATEMSAAAREQVEAEFRDAGWQVSCNDGILRFRP